MFIIEKDNKIRITKGDSATFSVEAYDLTGKKYEVKPDDVISMTVKKIPMQTVPTIYKEADAEHIISLDQEDTINLLPGVYVYQITLATDEDVYTIIPETIFDILEDLEDNE